MKRTRRIGEEEGRRNSTAPIPPPPPLKIMEKKTPKRDGNKARHDQRTSCRLHHFWRFPSTIHSRAGHFLISFPQPYITLFPLVPLCLYLDTLNGDEGMMPNVEWITTIPVVLAGVVVGVVVVAVVVVVVVRKVLKNGELPSLHPPPPVHSLTWLRLLEGGRSQEGRFTKAWNGRWLALPSSMDNCGRCVKSCSLSGPKCRLMFRCRGMGKGRGGGVMANEDGGCKSHWIVQWFSVEFDIYIIRLENTLCDLGSEANLASDVTGSGILSLTDFSVKSHPLPAERSNYGRSL